MSDLKCLMKKVLEKNRTIEQLEEIIKGYLQHCGNNYQICGLNTQAREAISFIEKGKVASMNKLKPCPFCGNILKEAVDSEEDGIRSYCCTTSSCFINGLWWSFDEGAADVAKWNRRPLEDIATVEIKQLKNKVSAMHFDLFSILNKYKAELYITEINSD